MTLPDIIFLAIGVFFVIRGYTKGFISVFMSVAAIVCGIGMGILFQGVLSPHIKDQTSVDSSVWQPFAAIAIVFIASYLALKILETVFQKFIKSIQKNSLDRFFGALWGAAEGAAVITLIVFFINSFEFEPGMKFLENSAVANYVVEFLKNVNIESINDISFTSKSHA